jgi:hypothetical protein
VTRVCVCDEISQLQAGADAVAAQLLTGLLDPFVLESL